MERTAADYLWAFSRGMFKDGTLLPVCAPRSYTAEEMKKAKKPMTVSPLIKYFILNQINTNPNKRLRTVELGDIALRSPELVSNPVPAGEKINISKCTGWGGFYCDRLASQGVIVKTTIPATSGPRKNMVVYVLTTKGKQWLEDNKIE